MTTHLTALTARESIAAGTMAFHFNRPAGFEFKPGQAIDLVLSAATGADDAGSRHTFSIVSAPFGDELVVATRMRDSDFRRRLDALAVGFPVTIDGPSGSLILAPEPGARGCADRRRLGITPLMSMLRQAAHEQRPQPLILLYSNRRPEDAAFLGELQRLEAQNPNSRLHATMTQITASHAPWNGAIPARSTLRC